MGGEAAFINNLMKSISKLLTSPPRLLPHKSPHIWDPITPSKVEEMDMMLRQREEQVASLERELDKQRELREAQVTRESFRYKTHKV